MLHRKSEELISRNLSLKVEIEKLRNNLASSEVSTILLFAIKLFKLRNNEGNIFSLKEPNVKKH